MPRPRVLREPRVVPIVFEAELYRKLEAAAKARGLSVSAFVRMLVERELRSMQQPERVQVPADPLSPSDPPDPLLQLEAQEFEAELSKMERRVRELEEVTNAVAGKGHLARTGFEPHRQKLLDRAFKLVEKWHEQKRWFYRLRRDLPREKAAEFSRRMADLKKRLNAMLELLGYEGGR
jgi:hypothetical protein